MSNKDKSEDISGETSEEFFDANDVFIESENKPKDKSETIVVTKKSNEDNNWFKNAFNTVLIPIESKQRPRVEEMFIKVKNKTKREAQMNDESNDQPSDPEEEVIDVSKGIKFEIFSDNETNDENGLKRTEVTVVNEDYIHIDVEDIEMSPKESVLFLINLISVLVLKLFIISGIVHWIYNYSNGIEWHLTEDKNYLNFHTFFMTLGICCLNIGLLLHRIARGWTRGPLQWFHTFLTLLTLMLFGIGVYAVVVTLNHLNAVHLYSVHSWLGFISLLSFTMLWTSAFIIFIFPRFGSDIQRLLIPVHNFFGRMTFTLICGTAIVGLSDKLKINKLDPAISQSNAAEGQSTGNDNSRETHEHWSMTEEEYLCNLIAICILLFAICVNQLSSNDIFRRRLCPEEQGIEVKTRFK